MWFGDVNFPDSPDSRFRKSGGSEYRSLASLGQECAGLNPAAHFAEVAALRQITGYVLVGRDSLREPNEDFEERAEPSYPRPLWEAH